MKHWATGIEFNPRKNTATDQKKKSDGQKSRREVKNEQVRSGQRASVMYQEEEKSDKKLYGIIIY